MRGQGRRLRTAVALAGLIGGSLVGPPAVSAATVVVPFSYTGGEQTFTVPANVTSINVALTGGSGGAGANGVAGGAGARVIGDLTVTPGQVLYIEVGGTGGVASAIAAGAAGFNGGGAGGQGQPPGGGGGGGASDIRSVPRALANSLPSRLMVAGGGGGGGGGVLLGTGGSSGASNSPNGVNGQGDAAGGGGGGGATQLAGGIGGSGQVGVQPGVSGSSAQGGAGGAGVSGGGGGGGGYFGGGGGGAASTGSGGGGGGGSSFWDAGVQNAGVFIGGNTSGITISYEDGAGGSDNGVVDAQVTVAAAAACIELSTTSIDFGTLPLGAENEPAAPAITVTNCSTAAEDILASGTNAQAPGVVWNLADTTATCATTLGLNTYRLGLGNANLPVPFSLGTVNETLATLQGGASSPYTALIHTACPGSAGAGQVLSMSINFLAIE